MENDDVWKVGQEVWCVVNGKGTVEAIHALTVLVSFCNEHCSTVATYRKTENGIRLMRTGRSSSANHLCLD